MKTFVLSLGGSVIIPDKVNIKFLRSFRDIIKKQNKRFIIVCGGGKVCREYLVAAKAIKKNKNHELDKLGIKATEMNAELLRVILADMANKKVHSDYRKKVGFKKVLVSAGLIPGTSTDFDAVMFAKKYNAKEIINLSNIRYVFDKDPRKYKDAKPLKNISWKNFRKIVGNKWVAGMNKPFDPVASKKAQELGLKVYIIKGTELDNFKRILDGKDFVGTVIS